MRYFEFAIKPVKPLTPAQSRIASLKHNVEVARKALAAERKAQQLAKARQKMQKLNAV